MRVKRWIIPALAASAVVAWGVFFRELGADDSLIVIEHADLDRIVSIDSIDTTADSGGDQIESGKKRTITPAEGTPNCIDPNTASEQSLMSISGIGPVLARRIREYRESEGLFETKDQLMEVKGIGPKTVEKIREYICFR